MWPISKRKTKNKNQNFVIRFLIWNEKTNFKKYLSFLKFHLCIEKGNTKKKFFWNYFDLKPISKNNNQNFWVHFLISNQKMNFIKFFHFSIFFMKLKNEKWKFFKIRFVLKSKNELYFWYTDWCTDFNWFFDFKNN